MGDAERALADALASAEESAGAAMQGEDYPAALTVLAGMRESVDTFFDEVLVMDEDQGLRENRLKLLNRFVGLFGAFADFGQLVE